MDSPDAHRWGGLDEIFRIASQDVTPNVTAAPIASPVMTAIAQAAHQNLSASFAAEHCGLGRRACGEVSCESCTAAMFAAAVGVLAAARVKRETGVFSALLART